MKILGIETSCDETSASVVEDGERVLSNIVSSQLEVHAGYGGVVPELAAREHLRNIDPVVQTALNDAHCSTRDIEAVAVTCAPGLVPALLVGVSYAKGVASCADIPLLGINHFLAHVYGAFLPDVSILRRQRTYPLLALVVSGGHTNLFLVQADGTTAVVGRTLDDAAGEAFDKAAKVLSLGYPGGPVIDRLARRGNPAAVDFPRALTGGGGRPVKAENRFNFSFSGLKTALLYHVRERHLREDELCDVVASYQEAIVDVLVSKTLSAARALSAQTVVVCGGVACNSRLRTAMTRMLQPLDACAVIAPPAYCTDNAAMVAGLAYPALRRGAVSSLDLSVCARLGPEPGTMPLAAV